MGGKKKKQKEQPKRSHFSNRPFKGLSLPDKTPSEPILPMPETTNEPPAQVENPEPLDDDAYFEQELLDVVPLTSAHQIVVKKAEPKPMLVEADEEALVMRHLDDLVHGEVAFNFADTSEYIEAAAEGFDRRLLKKLRKGEFSYQDHVDLHGLNREQARAKVGEFIRKSVLECKKCVLIVHGRGLGSKDNTPVIKNKLAAWLTRGSIGKKVLAYTSARPCDGGTGAVYVLLRTP